MLKFSGERKGRSSFIEASEKHYYEDAKERFMPSLFFQPSSEAAVDCRGHSWSTWFSDLPNSRCERLRL